MLDPHSDPGFGDAGQDADGLLMDDPPQLRAAPLSWTNSDRSAAPVTARVDFGPLADGWHYGSADHPALGNAFAEAMHGLDDRCGNRGRENLDIHDPGREATQPDQADRYRHLRSLLRQQLRRIGGVPGRSPEQSSEQAWQCPDPPELWVPAA